MFAGAIIIDEEEVVDEFPFMNSFVKLSASWQSLKGLSVLLWLACCVKGCRLGILTAFHRRVYAN